MKIISFLLLLFVTAAVITGCGSEKQSEPEVTIEGRWFSKKQYETGKKVVTPMPLWRPMFSNLQSKFLGIKGYMI